MNKTRVKYFDVFFHEVEETMNKWILKHELMPGFKVIKIHISHEQLIEGYFCVSGYIVYELEA